MQEQPTDSSFSIRIADAGLLMERRLAQVLAPYDVSPVEFRVLSLLAAGGPSTATDLAPLVPIDQSFISRTVQRLYEKRLLTRRRSRLDRRIVTLRINTDGEELVSAASESLRELDGELTQGIPDDQLGQINVALDQMIRHLRTGQGETPFG